MYDLYTKSIIIRPVLKYKLSIFGKVRWFDMILYWWIEINSTWGILEEDV